MYVYPKMCQNLVFVLAKYVLQTGYPDCQGTTVNKKQHLALTPDMRTMRTPQRLLGASGFRVAPPVGVDGAGSSAGASLLSSGASEALSFASFSGCKNEQISNAALRSASTKHQLQFPAFTCMSIVVKTASRIGALS